jgi:hypothetical protein
MSNSTVAASIALAPEALYRRVFFPRIGIFVKTCAPASAQRREPLRTVLLQVTVRNLAIARAVARADQLRAEPFAAAAHPSDAPRRHAGHQGKIRDVAGDDRAGAHERIGADDVTTDDGRVRPDGGERASA